MSALDAPLRKIARKIVSKFGKAVTLKRQAAGAYNTTTGAATLTVTSESISGVISIAARDERNGAVRAGDYKILVAATDAALTAAPTTGDRVDIDGSEYQIVDVEEMWSGGEIAAYHVAARS